MIKPDRLRTLMTEYGITQSELARRVGVSQAAIYKLVSGSGQGSKYLHKIADELGTTTGYLTGVLPSHEPTPGTPAHEIYLELLEQNGGGRDLSVGAQTVVASREAENVEIDSIDLSYGMGGAYLDTEVVDLEKLRFPLCWIREFTDSSPHLLTIAHGIGDSMSPTILDRDSVLIDRGQNRLEDALGDRIWAGVFGGLGIVKRMRALPNGTVRIMSDNPVVPDEIAADGELFIIGRVVGIAGRRL